ncbi:MAG TPA: agmatinase, partial [Thermoplasmata archaeon]|nr:agmatinase [Thermoplasmata archaeon]
MVVFADAGDTFEASEFVIFGSPGDRTSSFRRGSRLAPLAIRMASYNFETFDPDTGTDLDDIAVHDAGDVTPEADTIEEMTLRVLRAGKIPLILGGEHTLTIGACRAH